jgi:asparagine synthase (glutamine-hydrolysing)
VTARHDEPAPQSPGKTEALPRLYRPTDLEVAGGWLNGYDHSPAPAGPVLRPRATLEQVLLPHLERGNVHIAFSGGRDSSALLALSVRLARREGLPLPVPITLVYPGAAGTDEREWQHVVLAHLGVTERIVIGVTDEHDALGPIATGLLRRHGLIWPPNITPSWRMLDRACGGTLLTGENGDELFGTKRITPLANLLRMVKHRRLPDRRLYRLAAHAIAPPAVRERKAFQARGHRFWLRPEAAELLNRELARDFRAHSLHAGRNGWQYSFRRAVTTSYATLRTLGRQIGTTYVQPFADPGYVTAVSEAAGFFGWSGRDQTMARLFGDLLPPEILFRQSKATFNRAVFTELTRTFASDWDGSGVDPDVVDPEALRETWLSDYPHAMTMSLLHQAWLANQPAPVG